MEIRRPQGGVFSHNFEFFTQFRVFHTISSFSNFYARNVLGVLVKTCCTFLSEIVCNKFKTSSGLNIIQLLDETEQNIMIYQWRADQLFADAEGRGK